MLYEGGTSKFIKCIPKSSSNTLSSQLGELLSCYQQISFEMHEHKTNRINS
jgi:hypothetical protein